MSIEEKISSIYKPETTSFVSTVQFENATTFLIYTTESLFSTVQSITRPIVYRSPSTESKGKDYLLLIALIVIALCLLFFVILIIYCYFCCFKRSSKNSVRMSDISRNNQEAIETPVKIDQVEVEPFEIEQVKNSNRKSVAETLYFTIPSTTISFPEMSDILTDDFSCSDYEDTPEIS